MRRSAAVIDDEGEKSCKRICNRGDIYYGLPGASSTSPYFPPDQEMMPAPIFDIAEQFLNLEVQQSRLVTSITYPPPVALMYNPIDYAYDVHSLFVRKYCSNTKSVLFLGMNPGPFGMIQTGVPFGEVKMVRDWLKIEGQVQKPAYEHPQRPILGFQCNRSEVSGQRFWEFFKELCGTPEAFFYNCFVHNYCPVSFMTETAKNITPPELPQPVRKALLALCDKVLVDVITLLQVKFIVGVGRFAQERAQAAIKLGNLHGVQTGFLMHPSPINPAANKGWKTIAFQQLQEMGIMHLLAART